MSDLSSLYQEMIIDHGRHPRNFHVLDNPTVEQAAHNPLCGDQLTVYCRLKDNYIESVSFQGSGCAISMASASMMTELLTGQSVASALTLAGVFEDLVTGQAVDLERPELAKLKVLAGVSAFPARVKCATLCWHAAKAMVSDAHETVSTE